MKRKYDELSIGQSYTKEYTIEESMGEAFAKISGDYNPVHLDEIYASNTMFGRRIAHGMLLGSFISGILGNDFPGEGTIYLKQDLKFVKPVYYGDTITVTVSIVGLDDCKKRITLDTTCRNQDGGTVISGTALVMLDNE